jgi:hypothetical protein
MTSHVNDAGTWRNLKNVYVNDAGTWRDLKEVYVNDGGTWRSVFTSTFMPNIVVSRNDSGTPAELYIDNNGSIRQRIGSTITSYSTPTWTTDSNTSDYEIFVTVTSGSFSSGDATGTWLNMGTSRSWTRGAAVGATQTCNFTIQLRRISTSETINTATCQLECAR